MSGTLANIGLVVVFVLVGSMFAAAEIALVSLRESQVRALSTRGKRGAAVARLAEAPNRVPAAEAGGCRGQARRGPQPVPRGGPGRRHARRFPLRVLRRRHSVRGPRTG